MSVIESKNLRCELGDAEILERVQEMSAAFSEKEKLEAEFASLKASYKSKIAEQGSRAIRLQRSVVERAEWRDVTCTWEFSYQEGKKRLVRPDTGEVIEEAKITDEEAQGNLLEE